MRNSSIKWCSALTTAFVLALGPVTAIAAPAPPADAPPEPAPDEIPIVEIIPPPERAPIEPEPEPEPEVVPPAPEVIPATEQALDTTKIKTQQDVGIGLIATGGVVAVGGLGMTLAFTIIGDRRQNAEVPVLADIERAHALGQAGGVLLASGIAVVAVGGIILARARKQREREGSASASAWRVRVTPTLGGLVLQF